MKLRIVLWLLASGILMSCSDNFFEQHKDAFYKLYGNGTTQEAVSMHLTADGSVYLIGNQYVRNQDSAAVVLIRANASGNQLWSGRYFGKGYTQARAILELPSQELLVLASSRASEGKMHVPLLLKISNEGVVLSEYSLEQAAGATPEDRVAEDMVLGDAGVVFILGNILNEGVSVGSFIQKVDLASGSTLDQRVFKNSAATEGKKIFRNGDQYFVLGNTALEVGQSRNQNLFLATYSENLVEAGNVVMGSAHKDSFEKAYISSRNELVILSAEQEAGSKVSKGVVWFTNPLSLSVHRMVYLNYSPNDVPQAIKEDEGGDFYIAVNAIGERGNTNILLNKTDYAAAPLWPSAKMIGGAGEDSVEEVVIAGGYVYMLSTLDMQNENTLISLSKIRF